MSVTIYQPGTLPLTQSSYPEGNKEYTTADSYAYWIAAGGSGHHPPSTDWYRAVADLPGTVESRTDANHHLNELAYTSATGGETTVTLNLNAPVVPSSLMISYAPILTQNDAYGTTPPSPMIATDIWPKGAGIYNAYGAISVVSGVLHFVANGPNPQVGQQFRLGAYWPYNLAGQAIQIASRAGSFNSAGTATFLGTPPADCSGTLTSVSYFVPIAGTLLEANHGSLGYNGTINYDTGVLSINSPAPMRQGSNFTLRMQRNTLTSEASYFRGAIYRHWKREAGARRLRRRAFRSPSSY